MVVCVLSNGAIENQTIEFDEDVADSQSRSSVGASLARLVGMSLGSAATVADTVMRRSTRCAKGPSGLARRCGRTTRYMSAAPHRWHIRLMR